MSSLYDQLVSVNKMPSMTKEASSKFIAPEKVAGIAEELATIAQMMEQGSDIPVEDVSEEILPEELPAEEAPVEGTLEETIPEKNPAEAGEEAEENEEESEEAEEADEENQEEAEEEEKKEASSVDILVGLLKQAADEEMAPPAEAPAATDELMAILEEEAAAEENAEVEQVIDDIINERAVEIAAQILDSPAVQGEVMAEAEKIAYAIIPEILKIAGVTMEDYTKGLFKMAGCDESSAGAVLESAEKIASEKGLPIALVVEDIVKVATEEA